MPVGIGSGSSEVSCFLQLPVVAAILSDPKICPDGRKDLYEWSTKQISKLASQPPEFSLLVRPVSAGLQVCVQLVSVCVVIGSHDH